MTTISIFLPENNDGGDSDSPNKDEIIAIAKDK